MHWRNHRVAASLNAAFDLALVPLAFIAAVTTGRLLGKDPFVISDLWGILLLPLLLALIAWAAVLSGHPELYRYRPGRFGQLAMRLTVASLQGGGLFLILLFLFGRLHIGRATYVLQVVYAFLFLLGERALITLLMDALRRSGKGLQNILVVGTGPSARSLAEDTTAHPEWGMRIRGFISTGSERKLWRYRDVPLLGTLDELEAIVQNSHVDGVMFAVSLTELSRLRRPLRVCEETGTPALLLTDFFTPRIAVTELAAVGGRPVILFAPTSDRAYGILAKSLFDRLAALAGLVLILPILAAIGLAIKLEDRGPILFKQYRCGLNGRRFALLKFRSMVTNAETLKATLLGRNEVNGAAFKLTNDPRITRVGEFLRKTSLDELPQLWNVLCGHMSLVGPRPPLPDEVSHFDRWQRRKLSMKPGMTGLWQVSGRSTVDFEEWMKMDLNYIDHWSLKLDAKILLQTLPAVINGHGAR